MTREEVAKILGSMYYDFPLSFLYGFLLNVLIKQQLLVCPVEVDREKGFHLDLEDYLAGILILASELVRHLTVRSFEGFL